MLAYTISTRIKHKGDKKFLVRRYRRHRVLFLVINKIDLIRLYPDFKILREHTVFIPENVIITKARRKTSGTFVAGQSFSVELDRVWYEFPSANHF